MLALACAAEPAPRELLATDESLAALAPLGIADVIAVDDTFVLVGFEGETIGEVRLDADGVVVATLDGREARMTYSSEGMTIACDGRSLPTGAHDATVEGTQIVATECASALLAAHILLNVDIDSLAPPADVAGAQEALIAGPHKSVYCGYDPTTGLGFCYDFSGQCSAVNGLYLGSPCLGTGGILVCMRTCSSFYA